MESKVIAALKKVKREQWIVCGLAGILLLVIALPVGKSDSEEKQAGEAAPAIQDTAASSLREEYESQLTRILSQVQGVGQVAVTVTMESTGKKLVEKDKPEEIQNSTQKDAEGSQSSSESSSIQETTVYEEKEDGSQTPYITSETFPEIRGVLVVAEGGDNPVLVQQIQEAVMALFHVEAHKIKVLKMK